MRATRQTNPGVVKLAIIAHEEEWQELIKLLEDTLEEEVNSVLNGFLSILRQVVINGKQNWNERTEIETGEAS